MTSYLGRTASYWLAMLKPRQCQPIGSLRLVLFQEWSCLSDRPGKRKSLRFLEIAICVALRLPSDLATAESGFLSNHIDFPCHLYCSLANKSICNVNEFKKALKKRASLMWSTLLDEVCDWWTPKFCYGSNIYFGHNGCQGMRPNTAMMNLKTYLCIWWAIWFCLVYLCLEICCKASRHPSIWSLIYICSI